jgi:predicted small metal-binding protein
MPVKNRKVIDCRMFPNEIGCTLKISGNEKEVLKVAVRHAIEEHGHQDTPELRKQIRALLRNEES